MDCEWTEEVGGGVERSKVGTESFRGAEEVQRGLMMSGEVWRWTRSSWEDLIEICRGCER